MNIEQIKQQLAALTAAVEALNDPHAELKAAYEADPKLCIQYLEGADWFDCGTSPSWFYDTQYRIKPEVKPDTVMYCNTYGHNGHERYEDAKYAAASSSTGMVKITHDGEGKLKSVEIL